MVDGIDDAGPSHQVFDFSDIFITAAPKSPAERHGINAPPESSTPAYRASCEFIEPVMVLVDFFGVTRAVPPLASGLVPGVAPPNGDSRFFVLIATSGDPANSFLKRRTPPTPRSGTWPFHSRLYHSAPPGVSVPRAVPPPWRRASPYKLLPSFCGILHQDLTSLETG